MYRFIPDFLHEKQLKVADTSYLYTHQAALAERLDNTRLTKVGAKIAQVVGGSMATVHTTLAMEVDANYLKTAGVALGMAAAGYVVEKFAGDYETVLDFNAATTAAEIDRRNEPDLS